MEDRVWQNLIKLVVEKDLKSVKTPRLPVSKVACFIQKEYGEEWDGETNGFQVDFWYSWNINGKDFQYKGSLWYEDEFTFEEVK